MGLIIVGGSDKHFTFSQESKQDCWGDLGGVGGIKGACKSLSNAWQTGWNQRKFQVQGKYGAAKGRVRRMPWRTNVQISLLKYQDTLCLHQKSHQHFCRQICRSGFLFVFPVILVLYLILWSILVSVSSMA